MKLQFLRSLTVFLKYTSTNVLLDITLLVFIVARGHLRADMLVCRQRPALATRPGARSTSF